MPVTVLGTEDITTNKLTKSLPTINNLKCWVLPNAEKKNKARQNFKNKPG